MTRYAVLLLLVSLPLCCGCYHAQVRNDGNQVRRALLDMYEDQAMDNLIRAHDNLPFVQLNYHDVLVQATDQYTGTFTNNQTFSASRTLNFSTAVTGTLMRAVGSAFSFGGTGQRQDLLSFKADPITDQDDIYDKYGDCSIIVGRLCGPLNVSQIHETHYVMRWDLGVDEASRG